MTQDKVIWPLLAMVLNNNTNSLLISANRLKKKNSPQKSSTEPGHIKTRRMKALPI